VVVAEAQLVVKPETKGEQGPPGGIADRCLVGRVRCSRIMRRARDITSSGMVAHPDVDPVGVLDRQTYRGGTQGSRLCSEDHDRETENLKVCARTRDTRFIQVWAAKVASPTSCLGIKYDALRLVLVEIRCPARYPALLYIVQGWVSSRLQGRSPSRITRNES
jgi:hypothetical protein